MLDPYGLHLDWELIYMCGQLQTIDLFLNFPTMDMNMNVLKNNPEEVDPKQIERMTRYWGDESWRKEGYSSEGFLFDDMTEKVSNEAIVNAFVERLKNVAGFGNVLKPLPMKNSSNSVLYYLIFASNKPIANKIVDYIFNEQRKGNFDGRKFNN